MPAEELYEITRGNWTMGERRTKAKYALSVFRGIVREVYRIDSWSEAPARDPQQKAQIRWRFTGEVAPEMQKFVGGSVKHYCKSSAQLPFKYINC